jgi:hypothetical protein
MYEIIKSLNTTMMMMMMMMMMIFMIYSYLSTRQQIGFRQNIFVVAVLFIFY